jgi:GDP-4-dehydro-6-deoxy-D-mannose reductase
MLACRAVRDFGQQVVIARSFNHVGPGQDPRYAASSFARQIAQIEVGRQPALIEVGNLDAERDLTDVRDTVRAYLAIMKAGRPGRVYNVCSGRAYSMRTVLELLVRLSGIHVEIRSSQALLRPLDTPVLVGDGSRLRDELAWSPVIPLERTLTDLLDDWRRRVRTNLDPAAAIRP